jgi:hypothetical protein
MSFRQIILTEKPTPTRFGGFFIAGINRKTLEQSGFFMA